MSELKEHQFCESDEFFREYPGPLSNELRLYYLKSEADKVIAHHKYKRCLAMWLYLRECYWRCKHHNEKTRADWYEKWMDIFKKLAEHYWEV